LKFLVLYSNCVFVFVPGGTGKDDFCGVRPMAVINIQPQDFREVSPVFSVRQDWLTLLNDHSKVAIKEVTGNVVEEDGYEEMVGSRYSVRQTTVARITQDFLEGLDNIPSGQNLPAFIDRAKWAEILAELAQKETQCDGYSVMAMLSEMCDDYSTVLSVVTPDRMAELEAQIRAVNLEGETRQFCRKHGVSIGSSQFFDKLAEEIEKAQNSQDNYNSAENRAERYAIYRASGAGCENFWKDSDYVNDKAFHQINGLAEIMNFCRDNLPLQYGMWRDKKMA